MSDERCLISGILHRSLFIAHQHALRATRLHIPRP